MQTHKRFADAAGIVLAGGRSSRMGASKALLDWHGSTLLRRVVGILTRSVGGPVVVVSAAGQALPALPGSVELVIDSRADRGPLQGFVDALGAIGDRAAVAFVSSTDVPLLHPAFVRAVLAGVGDDVDAAAPVLDGHLQPLAAAYRVSVLARAQRLLADDRLAMRTLLEHCRVRRLTAADLPAPESLTNLNSAADYERARAAPAPPVTVDGSSARAWCLGDVLRGHAGVWLNGRPVDPDPELPLVAGDVLALS